MESSESQDEKHVLSSNSVKGSEANGNESVFYEKFLLDNLNNYWDELNDRLTVTRMVNDSVITESKENIAFKEVEIETLNRKLNSLHNISPLEHSAVEENSIFHSFDNISKLRLYAGDHIQKLKENIHNADVGMSGTFPKEMRNEKLIEAHKIANSLGTIVHTLFKEMDEMHDIQLQDKLEREINSIAFASSVDNLQNMFEKKLYEQTSLNKRLNMDCQQKANELSGIRDHLNYLSSTLSSAESKLLLSHNSLDSLDSSEEWNTPKRKELVSRKVSGGHRKEENGTMSKNSKLDVPDASQLKHLSRGELIECYKNEMISMRRQHESAVREKTEEIFKLKREFLEKANELSGIRDHLNYLSSTLSSAESKLLLSHNSLDCFEEWNTPKRTELVSRKGSGGHRKEENGTISKNSKSDVPDASQLKHLSKGELIEYYKNEMISMRRQHEYAVQEKTEEIFKLKREFLEKANELSGIRDHLNYLSSTLSSAESKLLVSYNSLDSLDSFEEWNTPKRKELVSRKGSGGHRKEENGTISKNSKSDVPDASQLKHLSRDELIEYYKNEMISMRRQHESAVQEMTEEIFKLKREFLEKANELSGIRDRLNYLSSTLSTAESKLLLSHNSLDSFEERNTPKRKEHVSRRVSGGHRKEENGTISKNSKSDVPDASQLKHLSRDELIEYYKNEMISLRRQYESAVQDKTEEIFKLKREFLEKANELSGIRDHLNYLSSTLSSAESKLLLSQNSLDSLDSFEEWNTPKREELVSRKVSGDHRKEENGTMSKNSKSDVPDASQLKNLSRGELIEYYKNEMISMRRQHESAVREKTEEVFKLKREFLRQKGSSPFKKDHEILRKTIAEIICKLDGIILEKDIKSVAQVDDEEVCILRKNINKLQSGNENLKSTLGVENKVKGPFSHFSDVSSQMLLHPTLETEYLQQIKKLEKDVNEMEMENYIKDVVYGNIIKEMICESKCLVCDLEAENRIMQDVMNVVVKGYPPDVMPVINSVISRHCTEKSHLEELLCDKEKRLCAEIEKNKMEEKMASSSVQTQNEEKHALQSVQLNQSIEEVKKLKEQRAKQGLLVLDKEAENDLLNNKINEALQQLHQYDSNFIKLNEELENVSNALDQAERQKSLFQSIIEDDQKKRSSYIANEKRQANQSEFVVKSIAVLLEASAKFEHKVLENIQRNEYRLKSLHHQCLALIQQANVFPKKATLYKQMCDIKSSNLQKAEAEVDLLGDEMDN